MRKQISGFCPESSRQQTILVDFLTITMPGDLAQHWKADAYYCEYASDHGCDTKGDHALNCPVYLKAKSLA